jgi:hypothetical protein
MTEDDAAWAAALREQRRQVYAGYSPVFWRPRPGVTGLHTRFLRRLIAIPFYSGYSAKGTPLSLADLNEPVPAELRTDEFVLRPIVADDAELDYAAVMATREHLRLWRQSTWPEDDFTVEENRKDLVECEERHLAHRAFTYTVLDPGGAECLGCVYVFRTTAKFLARAAVTPVGDDEWADMEAVVFFWARLSRMQAGMDERLLAALRTGFTEGWKLTRTVYATSEPFTQQVDLLTRTDMQLKFELQQPDQPQKRLVFG